MDAKGARCSALGIRYSAFGIRYSENREGVMGLLGYFEGSARRKRKGRDNSIATPAARVLHVPWNPFIRDSDKRRQEETRRRQGAKDGYSFRGLFV